MQPWWDPVLISQTCFPGFMCCFLSDRKSVVPPGTLSQELVLQQSWDVRVEGKAVEDEVKGHAC